MEYLNKGIRQALGALVAILALSLAVPSFAATTSVQKSSPKDAVLHEAKGLIDRGHMNPADLRQAIAGKASLGSRRRRK